MTLEALYEIRQLTGRTAPDGSHGTHFHAVKKDNRHALCGKTFGPRSKGWSLTEGTEVTCPRCLRKLKNK